MAKFWQWDWTEVTEEEYRANLTGLNTFFGAVLGFVLADVKTADLLDFAILLVFTAAIVIGIVYVSASSRRWFYAVLNLIFIVGLGRVLPDNAAEIGRLQVTLAVWTLMAASVEAFWAWQQHKDRKRASRSTA